MTTRSPAPRKAHRHVDDADDGIIFAAPLSVVAEFVTNVEIEAWYLDDSEAASFDGGANSSLPKFVVTSCLSYSNERYDHGFESVFVPATKAKPTRDDAPPDWELCVSDLHYVIRLPSVLQDQLSSGATARRRRHGPQLRYPSGFIFSTLPSLHGSNSSMTTHSQYHRRLVSMGTDEREVRLRPLPSSSAGTSDVNQSPFLTNVFQLRTLLVPPEASQVWVDEAHTSVSWARRYQQQPGARPRRKARHPVPPDHALLTPAAWMVPLSLRQQLVLLKVGLVRSSSVGKTDCESGSEWRKTHAPNCVVLSSLVVENFDDVDSTSATSIFNPSLFAGATVTTTGTFSLADACEVPSSPPTPQPILPTYTSREFHFSVLGSIAAVVDSFGGCITSKLQVGRTELVIAALAARATSKLCEEGGSQPQTTKRGRPTCATSSKKHGCEKEDGGHVRFFSRFVRSRKLEALSEKISMGSSCVPRVESVTWLQQCARDLLVFESHHATCGATIAPRLLHATAVNAYLNGRLSGRHNQCSPSDSVASISVPYSVRLLLEGSLWSTLQDQKVDEELISMNLGPLSGTPARVPTNPSLAATPGLSTPGTAFPPSQAASPHVSSPFFLKGDCPTPSPPSSIDTSLVPTATLSSGDLLCFGGPSSNSVVTKSSPKVSSFTVGPPGLLHTLLRSYFKGTKEKSASNKSSSRHDRSGPLLGEAIVNRLLTSTVVASRRDTLLGAVVAPHTPVTECSAAPDTVIPPRAPATAPAARPPAPDLVETSQQQLSSRVERKLQFGAAESAMDSEDGLLSKCSFDAHGSLRPTSALAKEPSALAAATHAYFRAICRSLSISRESSTRNGPARRRPISGFKRQRDGDEGGDSFTGSSSTSLGSPVTSQTTTPEKLFRGRSTPFAPCSPVGVGDGSDFAKNATGFAEIEVSHTNHKSMHLDTVFFARNVPFA